jgi:hypothetical protein
MASVDTRAASPIRYIPKKGKVITTKKGSARITTAATIRASVVT